MKSRNDNNDRCKPAKVIGDSTVELTTRELYKQMVQDDQSRPRQRSPLLEADLSDTRDLGALFRSIRQDGERIRELKEKRDPGTLDATLP